MTQLESLLRRYAEGSITQEEMEQLDTLTHRKEVLAGAEERAKVLHRRWVARTSLVVSFALIVTVTALAVWIPRQGVQVAGTPMMAQLTPSDQLDAPVVVTKAQPEASHPQAVVARKTPAAPLEESRPAVKPAPQQQESPVVAVTGEAELQEDVPMVYVREDQPVVACNSACSPDSVINDIWRFLRV